MCQQLLTVNLDEKLNSSKCNLSLESKIMTVHLSIQELQHCMCHWLQRVVWSLPSVIFLEAPRHKIR